MGPWLETAPGRYAAAWLQEQVDRAVADAFGFHAVQLGLVDFDGLRANRMPHRWLVDDDVGGPDPAAPSSTPPPGLTARSLISEFHELPFPSTSIDLAVLPHTLEMSVDPHATLAEVARVLMPEGRVVIVGFNPMSLWGLRQSSGWADRLGRSSSHLQEGSMHASEFLGYRRVRDWLRLLSFEVEGGRFGLWRPPVSSQARLERLAWMDRVGSHWWPVLGGMYVIEAVKRVRGIRLVGMKPQPARRAKAAPVVVASPSISERLVETADELTS
jgi:SAM-dependent methyltransferase